MESQVAIIILNWNGRGYLEKFLPSVCKYSKTPNNKIVVVDNNSDDDSCEFVSTNYPDIELITGQEVPGGTSIITSLSYLIFLLSSLIIGIAWISPTFNKPW